MAGLWVIELDQIKDKQRVGGSFTELFRLDALTRAGLPELGTVQVNRSISTFGTLRGIHVAPWHKYVFVGPGQVMAVIVDPRPDSETFGLYLQFALNERFALFVSAGLGNSYQVNGHREREVYYYYLVNETYRPRAEFGIAFDDPDLAIPWSMDDLQISEKDRHNPTLRAAVGK